MENIVINEEYAIKMLESIERIDSAVIQIKEAIEKFDAYSAVELEPILQPVLSIEDANKHLTIATDFPSL